MSALPPSLSPESLHPALWLAHQLGCQRDAVAATGFAALDAELPGGGWPARVLTELLLPQDGIGEMRLLAPALARLTQAGRCVMLFDPPARLCGAALVQWGVDIAQCVLVHSGRMDVANSVANSVAHSFAHSVSASAGPEGVLRRSGGQRAADFGWALEQALKSGQVGAVLAWPGAGYRMEAVRRLQMAAHSHDGPAFLLREEAARHRPSAAPLRLLLHSAGPDRLDVHVLKRRGPVLAQPLRLALQPVLSVRARSRASQPVAMPVATPRGPVPGKAARPVTAVLGAAGV